jgi:hypothetical protein
MSLDDNTPVRIRGKGLTEEIREAKLYYTAFKKAEDAGGRVIDMTRPDGPETYYEEDIDNAGRWRIGDDFIAQHKDDEDRKGARATELKAPPRSNPFWASKETLPGDAAKTYQRLMAERFPVR